MSRQTFVRIEVGFLVVAFLWVLCGGILVPVDRYTAVFAHAYFFLLTGWGFFAWRVLPNVTVDFLSVGIAAASLICLAVGLHYFCSWLHREIVRKRALQRLGPDETLPELPSWKLRTTLSILGIVMLMFVAGISAVGTVHQFVWLKTRQ